MENLENFNNKLKNELIQKNLYTSSFQYYLIEELWINELENNFNLFNNLISSDTKFSFPKNDPRFINYFATLISYLRDDKKFRLINKKFIESYKNNKITFRYQY